ncbi:MAG: Spy/CpxP family protein refolding chaperone [Desulfuromusa sp.]|nr:Spy/CpxP family protein refolding chaperone [Desulfuromusa sp.]
MKKRIIISTVLIGSLMTGGLAMAKSYGPGYDNRNSKGQKMMTEEQHQQRSENRLERMTIILDLDKSQQKQIKELSDQHWQERESVRDEMREGRDERHSAMRNGEIDEAAIRANLAKRAGLKADRIVEREQMKKKLYALLTVEQQEKAEKIWETRVNDRNGQHGKGFGF